MKRTLDFTQISAFDAPKQSPGFLLWKMSIAWRRQVELALLKFDLTHPQFVVLATLAWLTREGNTVSQNEVGKMAGLDPNTNSQILKGLEKKELLIRKSAKDARVKSPALTRKGQARIKKALPTVEEVDEIFFRRLSATEKNQLVSLFNQLL